MNEILTLQEITDKEIIYSSKTNDLYEFNEMWKEYWYNYFLEEFKESSLLQQNHKLQTERNYLTEYINKIIKVNNSLLNENISLGERIEKLERKNKLKDLEITSFREKIGKQPTGFLDATIKLINKNAQVYELVKENERLKEVVETNQNPMNAINTSKIDEILSLKAQGLNYSEISTKTGVSTASISRYVNKNKERLRELEHSAKSSSSI